ncbi:hypothetical protein Fcan01_24171 [Folsomia candida]|uniref:Uncharacterized protein n=1 Tax=Folsomia candida TaxID=158441 RepID=A0A226D2A8_FOLCA|nr:hypothetical protein Fcan01_25811 [Folsomia candida]OXA40842.1 hypothetical protein Fcan01_24171 [Folsomia candida]
MDDVLNELYPKRPLLWNMFLPACGTTTNVYIRHAPSTEKVDSAEHRVLGYIFAEYSFLLVCRAPSKTRQSSTEQGSATEQVILANRQQILIYWYLCHDGFVRNVTLKTEPFDSFFAYTERSAHSLELGGFYGLGKKLDDWINTATHWHIFYYERKWQENLRCLDSVMSIVTIKPKADGQVRIYFWTGKYFKISFLLTAVDNRLKFCAWFRKRLTRKILAFFQGVKQGCDGVGDEPVFLRSRSVIDIALDFELLKSPTWCYHRQLATYTTYLKFDIYAQKKNNPFDPRTYQSQIQNILGIIFNAANETLVEKIYCPGFAAILYDETNPINFADTTTVITVHSLVYIYSFGFINASFNIWLFVLATVFEECGYVPGKFERNNFFRLILGSWCLMSVILTNCYNGIMITELNAPLDSSHPTLFDHLLCERISKNDTFKIFKRFRHYYKRIENNSELLVQGEDLPKYGYDRVGWYLVILATLRDCQTKDSIYCQPGYTNIQEFDNPFAARKCFNLISLPNGYVSGYANIPEFLDHLLRSLTFRVRYMQYTKTSASSREMRLLNFFNPRHTHHPTGFQYLNLNQTFVQVQGSMERELVQCGKSVYISNSDVIEAEFDFLTKQYPSRRFYKGKEIYEEVTYRWHTSLAGVSHVPKYFKYLIESGIYRRLQLEEIYQKYLRRKHFKTETVIGAVRLDGALFTLFLICGAIVLLASFVAIVEIRDRLVPFVRQGMISKLRDSFVKLAREKESDLLGHPKSVELPND